MRMRRVSILLASVLLLSAVFAGTVYASDFSSDNVTVSNIRVSPSSLSVEGSVSVTINVSVDTSRADGGLNNVRVTGAGVNSDTVQEITIGADSDLHFSLSVSSSQIGKAIPLTLKWDGTGTTSLPFQVTVGSSAPTEPHVKFTRTVDKTSFRAGDTLTLVYNIENDGNFDISNISVTDGGLPDMAPLTQSALKVGDSASFRTTFSPQADFTSSPKLTFTANGKSYWTTCASVTVPLDSPDLTAILDASPPAVNSGDNVTLLCTLTNTGNSKLTNIIINEKSLGANLFPTATLDVGESKRFSKTVLLTATTTFQYEITAKDGSGAMVNAVTQALEVPVNQNITLDDLKIVAVPDALQLSQPGSVNFNITIQNNGTEPIANASILDQTGAPIKTYPTLLVGQTAFSCSYNVDKTTKFNFTLSVPGEGGSSQQVLSGETEIVVAAPSASAMASATPTDASSSASAEATAGAGSSGRMITLITALLVIGVLIIITVFVLFAMMARDKRRRGGKKR